MKKTFILFIFILFTHLHADVERRAAIDIGSGGTKVAIGDVDTETNQILQVVLDRSFPVAYQASLDQSIDGTFDEQTQQKGIEAFAEIKALADEYKVQNIAAIATSAFRKAVNAKEFAEQVQAQTGISIQIIPQKQEGEIAYFSALATGEFDPQEMVVWDIGTGSLQLTTANEEDELSVYMGEQMGSVAFKSYIIKMIQEYDVQDKPSPNPISEEDLKSADSYARAFARKAHPIIKQKIQNQGSVVGIGRLFYHSIRPIASENGVITRKGLREFIKNSLNKTDAELNNPFADLDVTNCILALAMMKALHIHKVHPIETTTTRGLLVAPAYWQN